jgi:CBS domain-containing protein
MGKLVKEMMSAKPVLISKNASAQEAAQKMAEADVGVLPVWDDKLGAIVGMVTDRDITKGMANRGTIDFMVNEVMSQGVHHINEDAEVTAAAHYMGEKQLRRLMVTNREKKFVGIISLGDIRTQNVGFQPEELITIVYEVTKGRQYRRGQQKEKLEREGQKMEGQQLKGEQFKGEGQKMEGQQLKGEGQKLKGEGKKPKGEKVKGQKLEGQQLKGEQFKGEGQQFKGEQLKGEQFKGEGQKLEGQQLKGEGQKLEGQQFEGQQLKGQQFERQGEKWQGKEPEQEQEPQLFRSFLEHQQELQGGQKEKFKEGSQLKEGSQFQKEGVQQQQQQQQPPLQTSQ